MILTVEATTEANRVTTDASDRTHSKSVLTGDRRLRSGWGSSRQEQTRPLAGDAVINRPATQRTHAISVHAPPASVWQWIVQMGRAGWYTPAYVHRFWRVRDPSADRIHPELQRLEVGELIPDGPPGTPVFTVVDVDPPRSLVLHSERLPMTARPPDRAGGRHQLYLDFSWAFVLEAGEHGSTRVLLRTRNAKNSQPVDLLARALLIPADIATSRWMLKGIKRRVEAGSLRRSVMPTSRRIALDAEHAIRRNAASGFFEADVTAARGRIDEHYRRTGEALSFTAFICRAVARAVAREPHANSIRGHRNRLIAFDDVDVLLMIEAQVDGQSLAIAHIIRHANLKSVAEIHHEIRAAQTDPLAGDSGRLLRMGRFIPAPVRHMALRFIDKRPILSKRLKGTVSISAVGMFGRGGGWGLASLHHTVGVIVGGVATRSVAGPGGSEAREYVSLTLSFDHDIFDGAPAARLIHELKQRIEAAEGLPGLDARPATGTRSAGPSGSS